MRLSRFFAVNHHASSLALVFGSRQVSDLINPLTLAVQRHPTVDELAATFTIFPSLSASVAYS